MVWLRGSTAPAHLPVPCQPLHTDFALRAPLCRLFCRRVRQELPGACPGLAAAAGAVHDCHAVHLPPAALGWCRGRMQTSLHTCCLGARLLPAGTAVPRLAAALAQRVPAGPARSSCAATLSRWAPAGPRAETVKCAQRGILVSRAGASGTFAALDGGREARSSIWQEARQRQREPCFPGDSAGQTG